MVIFVLSPRSPRVFRASDRRARRLLGEDGREAVSAPATLTLSCIDVFAAPPFENPVKADLRIFLVPMSIERG
jgi:hypothetical protein